MSKPKKSKRKTKAKKNSKPKKATTKAKTSTKKKAATKAASKTKAAAKSKATSKKSSVSKASSKKSAASKAKTKAKAKADAVVAATPQQVADPLTPIAPAEDFHRIAVDATGVSLSLPKVWHFETQAGALAAFNVSPPHNRCRMDLTVQQLPGMAAMLPLKSLLMQALGQAGPQARVSEMQLPGIKIAKSEVCFVDPRMGPARTRTALATCNGLWILMAFNFWEADIGWAHPVWVTALQSIQVN